VGGLVVAGDHVRQQRVVVLRAQIPVRVRRGEHRVKERVLQLHWRGGWGGTFCQRGGQPRDLVPELLRVGPFQRVDQLAPHKKEKRRDSGDAVQGRQVVKFVDVHPHKQHVPVRRLQLGNGGLDGFARAAPIGLKLGHHQRDLVKHRRKVVAGRDRAHRSLCRGPRWGGMDDDDERKIEFQSPNSKPIDQS